MSPKRTPRPPRAVPACPWCGPGTELGVHYDAMGSVQIACSACSAGGPKIAITGEFTQAEEAAIAAWSGRRGGHIEQETVGRVKLAVGLHCLTGKLTPDATISVAWSDLNALLKAVTVADGPAGDQP
jgi:Restriction alleviation protein Lar